MVKLYTSILALTLTTSFALAAPHPFSHGREHNNRDLDRRDLDEEFSRRYLLDASDDLETREPGFFDGVKHAFQDVGNVVNKGVHVAEDVAQNPVVQLAASVIPGESEVAAAGKVVGALGKVNKIGKTAKKAQKVAKEVDKINPSNSGHNSNSRKQTSSRRHRG